MWTTTTIRKKTRGLTTKIEEKLDSVFESMEPLFEKMADALDLDDDDDEEREDPDCCAMTDGVVSITTNKGHVVIEGELKSLKINGTDISL